MKVERSNPLGAADSPDAPISMAFRGFGYEAVTLNLP
jgi:hypothetical protein